MTSKICPCSGEVYKIALSGFSDLQGSILWILHMHLGMSIAQHFRAERDMRGYPVQLIDFIDGKLMPGNAWHHSQGPAAN